VIPSEAEPRRNDADEAAEKEIKTKVAIICEACAGDVDGGTDGYENKNECIHRWSSGLVANRHYLLPGGCQARLLVVEGKERLVPKVGWCNRRRVRRVRAKWSRWQEGDSDGKFRGQK
jgi:hypothetical protein